MGLKFGSLQTIDKGVSSWVIEIKINFPFERTSKRRKGYPSETQVKKGYRVVHGTKDLQEKLGRNDPCPCSSGKIFKRCCMKSGFFWRFKSRWLLSLRMARFALSRAQPHASMDNIDRAIEPGLRQSLQLYQYAIVLGVCAAEPPLLRTCRIAPENVYLFVA